MAIWIIFAAMAAAALGYSPLPIMVIGGVAVALAAYVMSRHASLLRLGVSLALFASGTFFIKEMLGPLLESGASGFEFEALRFLTSSELLMTLSAVVMLISIRLSVFGGGTLDSAMKPASTPSDQGDQKN